VTVLLLNITTEGVMKRSS